MVTMSPKKCQFVSYRLDKVQAAIYKRFDFSKLAIQISFKFSFKPVYYIATNRKSPFSNNFQNDLNCCHIKLISSNSIFP